jgi:hypothetical protein
MKSKSLDIVKIILGIIILFFLFHIFFTKDRISEDSYNYDLEKDGVCIIPSVFQNYEIQIMKNLCKNENYKEMKQLLLNHHLLKNSCLHKTGKDYIFQDYIWIIKKSLIHTCHRDNNGDFFNKGQKHPSYTVLIYLEPMEKCLGVIPKSHYKKYSYGINLVDPVIHLPCNSGDIIIFNANLIHVGAFNKKKENLRCQMKLSHKEDIPILNFYQNFNKVLDQENNLPEILTHLQKRASCAMPIFSDLTQSENVRTVRGSLENVDIGFFQKIFSFLFYGNKDYYDLPNAF